MRLRKVKSALVRTYVDVERNHTLQMAAALSYYFVMALFPALIFLSAIVAFLPVTGLFDQALQLMSPFVPTEGMVVIRKVLKDGSRQIVAPFCRWDWSALFGRHQEDSRPRLKL